MVVAGTRFASISALRKRVASVLDSVGATADLAESHPEHLEIVNALLQRHPERCAHRRGTAHRRGPRRVNRNTARRHTS